jgi:CubicO group peptidase (beta-lactamase class C family)
MNAQESDLLRPAVSSEEDNTPVNVDAILQSILGRGAERFGMAGTVLRGERIIAQGAAGVRKRGTAERIMFDDQFHLGSCTKAMTATLVALLVEEGKLNWTTTLGELFDDTVKPMHPAWKKVTLRQVLAHRAGLPLEPDDPVGVFTLMRETYASLCGHPELMRPPRARLGTLPQQRLEVVRQSLSRPPGFPPDTKFYYSNVGYILAGTVLEQLTGQAWEELMRERLFQPLVISTGGFGAPGTTNKTQQAWGHSPVFGKPLDDGLSAQPVGHAAPGLETLAAAFGTSEATEGGPPAWSSHPKLTLPCSSRATAAGRASLPGKPARRSRH